MNFRKHDLATGTFELLVNLTVWQFEDITYYNLKATEASLALKILSFTPVF